MSPNSGLLFERIDQPSEYKPFVFVLMPFDLEFDDVYQVGIKPACHDAGARCERVDEQIFLESMLDRIYQQITLADYIVADMTGRNANVFYEVGYAHGLKKKVILLTKNSDDIPFDLKHYPHIVYKGSITTLKNELGRRLKQLIQETANSAPEEKIPGPATPKPDYPFRNRKSIETDDADLSWVYNITVTGEMSRIKEFAREVASWPDCVSKEIGKQGDHTEVDVEFVFKRRFPTDELVAAAKAEDLKTVLAPAVRRVDLND